MKKGVPILAEMGTGEFVEMDLVQKITFEKTWNFTTDIFRVLCFNPWYAAGVLAVLFATAFCLMQSAQIKRTARQADESGEQEKERYAGEIYRMWTAKRAMLAIILLTAGVFIMFSSEHRFSNTVFLKKEVSDDSESSYASCDVTMNTTYENLTPGREYTVLYRSDSNACSATFIPPSKCGELEVKVPVFSTGTDITILPADNVGSGNEKDGYFKSAADAVAYESTGVSGNASSSAPAEHSDANGTPPADMEIVRDADIPASGGAVSIYAPHGIPYVFITTEKTEQFRHYNGVMCDNTNANRMAASAAAASLLCTILAVLLIVETLFLALTALQNYNVTLTVAPLITVSACGAAYYALYQMSANAQMVMAAHAFLLAAMVLCAIISDSLRRKEQDSGAFDTGYDDGDGEECGDMHDDPYGWY